jgi:hypothetical protein
MQTAWTTIPLRFISAEEVFIIRESLRCGVGLPRNLMGDGIEIRRPLLHLRVPEVVVRCPSSSTITIRHGRKPLDRSGLHQQE